MNTAHLNVFSQLRGVDTTPLKEGLIHHYSFEETTGTIAADDIGVSDGLYIGGPTPRSGQVGTSLLFDGVDDGIDFVGNLDMTSFPFAIKLWVNIQDINDGLFFMTGDSLTAYTGISLVNQLGAVYVRFGDGLGKLSINRSDYRQSFSSLSNGWNHIVVNFLAFGNIQIFVNGVNSSVTYVSGTGSSVDLANAQYTLGDNGGGTFLSYHIDELGIYDRALTQQIVTDIYNLESAGISII